MSIAALRRRVPAPEAAKVPEVIAVFWLVKLCTTAGGEAGSDYLSRYGNLVGGGTVALLFLAGIVAQFRSRRYRAASYWFFAYAIAIFGTALSDFLHLDVHLPYLVTSMLWAVVLAAVFTLGTAVGDLTAVSFHLGFAGSTALFAVLFVLPALGWRFLGLPAVPAFWASYVMTRPLGASIADWLDKPTSATGLGLGNGPTLALFTIVVCALVVYLTVRRPDVQPEDVRRDLEDVGVAG